MNTDLPQLRRMLRRVIARKRLALALDRAAVLTVASAGLAVGLTLVDRLVDLGWPTWMLITIALLGLPIGAVSAFLHRFEIGTLAAQLDEQFGLDNRLSTAMAVADESRSATGTLERAVERGFAEIVCLEAEAVTREVDSHRAVRLRWQHSTTAAVFMLLSAGVLSIALPSLSGIWPDRSDAQQLAQLQERRSRAASSIRDAAQRIELLQSTDQETDSMSAGASADRADEVAKDLDRLASQLTGEKEDGNSEKNDAGDSIAEAADKLNSLAGDLESRARTTEQARDEVLERFSGLTEPSDQSNQSEFADSPAFREFVESLRNGRLDEAADRLADADRDIRDKTPDERDAIARRLREMAEQISPVEPPEQQSDAISPNDAQKILEDAGIDPDEAKKLAEQTQSSDELEKTLREEQQIDPATARELAERLAKQKQLEKARELADQQTNETAERMREWADSIERSREQSQPAPQPSSTADETKPSPQEQPDLDRNAEEQRPRQNPPSADESQKPGQEQRQNPQKEDRRQRDSAKPTDPQQQTTGKPEHQSQESHSPEEQRPDHPNEEADRRPAPNENPNGQSGEGREIQPRGGREQPGEQERIDTPDSQNDGQQSAAREGAPGERPAQSPSARDLQRALRQVENLRRTADRNQQVSDEMRERARRLVEEMSPEEREQLRRWARNPEQQPLPQPTQQSEDTSGSPPFGEKSPNRAQSRGGATAAGGTNADDGASDQAFNYRIEDIDARQGEQGDESDHRETVLSEWYRDRRDNEAHPSELPPGSSGVEGAPAQPPTEVRRRAAQSIERALSEEAVAPRYRALLKRWSKFFSEQAEQSRDDGGQGTAGSSDNP